MHISVIIPTFNRAGSVGDAIDSVLAQTVLRGAQSVHRTAQARVEIIVVDDGSTDDTSDALQRFDGRVTVIRQDNGGVSAARNAGLARAQGEWITFLDSDDLWLPNRLDVLARDTASTDAGVHVADLVLEGPGYSESVLDIRGLVFPEDRAVRVARALPLVVSGLSLNAIACRRTWLTATGGFRPDLRMYEDLDLLTRLALQGPWLFTSTVVCRARRLDEAPGLALTAAAALATIPTRRALVGIFDRLATMQGLDGDDGRCAQMALSGAHFGLGQALLATGTWSEAMPSLVAAARRHPVPWRGALKSLAALLLGARHYATLSGRARGFYREDASAHTPVANAGRRSTT